MAHHPFKVVMTCVLLAIWTASAWGQGGRRDRGVYKTRIAPTWSDDNSRFWYRNELPGDKKEFVLVDVNQGTRVAAFDHAKLAAGLAAALGKKESEMDAAR